MYANYHTHTSLCHHATGTMREYVEEAIKSGIKILGFSDHSPYLFDGDYYSYFRMLPQEAYEYVEEVAKLRDEYKNDITIYTGFEMEYYPEIFERTIDFIKEIGYDYLILGQHALNNEYDAIYSSNTARNNKNDLTTYVNQTIAGMETGEFLYVAHPDLIYYREDLEFYKKEMTRLCECAKRLNIPLEINLLGFEAKRAYPYDEFWKIVAEIGNDTIFGIDAHKISALSDKETEKTGIEFAKRMGLKPLMEISSFPERII